MARKTVRILISAVLYIFLIWFILPVGFGVLNPGNILGIILCGILLIKFSFPKIYSMINCFLSGNKITKVLWNTGKVCFSLFCIYAVIISGLMIFAVNAPVNEESTAVVLGAQVKYGRPSVLLQQRINAAYNYLNENKNAKAVVTGGQGSDETISEGQCMYDTLVGMGIDKDRILIEDKAENTQQNIKYSYDIIEKENLNKSLAIVTDSYHQLRARLIANKQNINSDIGAINTENTFIGYITYPTYFVREWIAIPVELLK